MHVGTRIKQIRISKHLKQSAVARALGMSVTAYSDIETEKTSNVSIQRIEQIAKVLQVPPVEIIYTDKSNNELLKRNEELKQALEEKEQELKQLKEDKV
jgi:transcriptional regulator with XRE-family HTH domain